MNLPRRIPELPLPMRLSRDERAILLVLARAPHGISLSLPLYCDVTWNMRPHLTNWAFYRSLLRLRSCGVLFYRKSRLTDEELRQLIEELADPSRPISAPTPESVRLALKFIRSIRWAARSLPQR